MRININNIILVLKLSLNLISFSVNGFRSIGETDCRVTL